jgi:DNA invertase Pin-like site-specific DNA recombinase
MVLIGYARVSTDEQTTDPQIDALKAAGCAIIQREHGSGGDRARPELKRAIERCVGGDVLVVVRIDGWPAHSPTCSRSLRRSMPEGRGFARSATRSAPSAHRWHGSGA